MFADMRRESSLLLALKHLWAPPEWRRLSDGDSAMG
jgi:hypothetical protein